MLDKTSRTDQTKICDCLLLVVGGTEVGPEDGADDTGVDTGFEVGGAGGVVAAPGWHLSIKLVYVSERDGGSLTGNNMLG